MNEPTAGPPPAPAGTRRLVARELLRGLDLIPNLSFEDGGLARIREGIGGVRRAQPLPAALEAIVRDERFVPGPADAPDVRVLVYTPPGPARRRPVYLHVHGGGFVLGTPEINDAANRQTALERNCIVVSVGYRLAPETRWPGALDDCYAVLAWLHGGAGGLDIDRDRIVIGGESAGGGHAAALALRARDRGEYPVRALILDCPMLDDRTGSGGDPHPVCGEFVWTPAHNRFAWAALLGVTPGGPDVDAAAVPARAADLADLPPTFIIVGALDLFLEEGLEFARRLARAGVALALHVVPGAYHGFGIAGPAAPQVMMAERLRHDAIAEAFAITDAAE